MKWDVRRGDGGVGGVELTWVQALGRARMTAKYCLVNLRRKIRAVECNVCGCVCSTKISTADYL